MTSFRTQIVASIVGSLGLVWVLTPSGLNVQFQARTGAPVTLEKAELLLVGWGWTDRIALPVNGGSSLHLDFDSPKLRSAIAEKKPTDVLLFAQAKDMAPVVSERFAWPHPGDGPITVTFRNGPSTTIAEGATGEITVLLNSPSTRIVRFLDQAGNPVSGLNVSVAMFWANDNHCGRVSGAEHVLTGLTDKDGRLAVPAGDFKYVFEIMVQYNTDPRYAFTNPDASDVMPTYLTAYLDQPETVISVQKEKRFVRVHVYAGDKPLAGAVFSGGMNLGLCGAGWGQVAVSDANGEAIIEHFYPLENEILCLANDNGILWKADAKDLAEFVEIRLPATVRERPTIFGPCP
jgi:hypothetical protein